MRAGDLMLADMGLFIFFMVLSVLAMVIVASITQTRKSKEYRRYLTDMYVSSKIRLLASNDGLKINDEEEAFKAWSKKDKVRNVEYNLDDAVEEDLIGKIEEPIKKGK